MAERLTVINIKGDSDKIVEAITSIQPVMNRVGKENGAIFHVSARTDDGVMIVNVWRDAEGSDAAASHPDVQQALAEAMSSSGVTAPPERTHYEVAEYQIP